MTGCAKVRNIVTPAVASAGAMIPPPPAAACFACGSGDFMATLVNHERLHFHICRSCAVDILPGFFADAMANGRTTNVQVQNTVLAEFATAFWHHLVAARRLTREAIRQHTRKAVPVKPTPEERLAARKAATLAVMALPDGVSNALTNATAGVDLGLSRDLRTALRGRIRVLERRQGIRR